MSNNENTGSNNTQGDENTEFNENLENAEAKLVDADFSGLDNPASDIAAEMQSLKAEVADNKDKYLRSLAEFENYKRRALKDRSDLLKYQGERFISELLDVVDNFELASQHKDAAPEKFIEGMDLIYKKLQDLLTKWEVKGESAIGKDFDPNLYNAISKVEVDDAPPGTIINELKKAYFYKDKLLRVGEVVVAAEKSGQ